MTLKQQHLHQTIYNQREPKAVTPKMTVSDDQRLDQTKPGSGMEANNVAQGMATLEQEQQLWRPGVKAEQVLVSHL